MKTLALAASMLSISMALPPQGPASRTGEWTARLSDNWTRNNERWVSFQLERDDQRRWGISIRRSELPGLPETGDDWTGDARFALKRDAGTIDFEGRFRDGRGSGTYRFTANPDYIAGMRKLGYERIEDDDLFRLTVHDVSRTFVTSLQKEGYRNASLENLVRMRIHGATPEYVAEMRDAGMSNLSIEELIRTRIHGATPRFIQDVKKAGYDRLTVDDLVRMRIHGVTPEFIREMRDLGYKDQSIEQLIRLRIHGVTPAFMKEIRGLGYTDLTLDDFVKMRIHGVTPQFIKELKDLGYGGIKASRLVQFRIHGVNADFIREARDAGFKDLDEEDLVDLSIHGRRWLKKRRGSRSGSRAGRRLGLLRVAAVPTEVRLSGDCSFPSFRKTRELLRNPQTLARAGSCSGAASRLRLKAIMPSGVRAVTLVGLVCLSAACQMVAARAPTSREASNRC